MLLADVPLCRPSVPFTVMGLYRSLSTFVRSEIRKVDAVSLFSLLLSLAPLDCGPVEHCYPHKGWSILGDQYTEATFCITANLSVSPRNIQFDSNAFDLWQNQLR